MLQHFREKPIILISTPNHSDTLPFFRLGNYIRAVKKAGGTPLLLPPAEINLRVLHICQGILLTGGGDLCPKQFGDEPHPTTYDVDEERDAVELKITQFAMTHQIPHLGVCRGMQVMNVASGGTLFTHLSDYFDGVTHRLETFGKIHPAEHFINISPGSQLAHITKNTRFRSISAHHCAVKTLPSGWRVVAHADDNVVEAIECEHHPFAIGIQAHPELAYQQIENRSIFAAFVEAAKRFKFCC